MWTPGPAPLECRPLSLRNCPGSRLRVIVGLPRCGQTVNLLAVVITLLRVKQNDHLLEH